MGVNIIIITKFLSDGGNKMNENHIVEWISDYGASCHMIG